MARAFAGPLCRLHAATPSAAARLVPGIEAWRRDLLAGLAGRIAVSDWREDPEVAGAWTDLGAAGWPALRLFAFYAEHSELELPGTVPALPELDRAFRAASDARFERSRYGQLLACSVWLPGDFTPTVRAQLPDGSDAEIGSVAVLCDQLRWLDRRTFQADAADRRAWLGEAAPAGGPLLPAARRGLAALWAAAAAAERLGLPLCVRED